MRYLLLAIICIPLQGADWLSASADSTHSRFQPAETDLSRETVADLKLLWKMQFDETITAPVILGPIYTHRGIKELVFFAGAGDNIYAVDADLARVFWKRHFDTKPAASNCKAELTATPVLAPYYGTIPEGDEAATPRRSLFVLTSDGQLQTVRPADAHDLFLPRPFVPPGSVASDLTLTGNVVTTNVTGGCGNPKTGGWSLRLENPPGPAKVQAARPVTKAAFANDYKITAETDSLNASRKNSPAWKVSGLQSPLAPLIANGLVFTVSKNTLLVYNLESGRQLYSSGANGSDSATASLALANGHVYFVTGKTIYCYGFPIEF